MQPSFVIVNWHFEISTYIKIFQANSLLHVFVAVVGLCLV